MKRIVLTSIIACLLLCALVSCTGTLSEAEIISQSIGVSVDNGCIEFYTDDHGGFHGDGETYAQITFADNSFLNKIKENEQWSELPLSQNLNVIVYGGELPNGESWLPFIQDENDQPLLPTISNGYYFFKDRYNEYKKDEKDDSLLFERYSMNFTLAIYDADSHTLYFYEYDS